MMNLQVKIFISEEEWDAQTFGVFDAVLFEEIHRLIFSRHRGNASACTDFLDNLSQACGELISDSLARDVEAANLRVSRQMRND